MTLLDPTGGAGYMFGAKLPSTHQTLVGANQPKAVDGDAGGAYNPSNTLTIGGLGITLAGTANLKLASRPITRRQPMTGLTVSANFYPLVNLVWRNWTASNGHVWFPISRLLHGAPLTDVGMRILPAGGHGGDVTPPSFELFRTPIGGTGASLGTSADATGGVIPGYQAEHSILLSGLASVIDLATYTYDITLTGETGANYVQGCYFLSLWATCTCTAYSEY
jgi:hypothetical protein